MPQNPFAPSEQDAMKLKRTAYDHSHRRLQSTEWGRIDPCLIKEVIPGETVEIDSSVTVQGMPTVFPLQNPVKVSVSYFYGRNRTVQDNFEDMIFSTKDVEHPWLRISNENAKKEIGTGSLADFFGLPSTIGSSSELSLNVNFDYIGTFGYRPSNLEPYTYFSSYISDGVRLGLYPNTDVTTLMYGLFLGYIKDPIKDVFHISFNLSSNFVDLSTSIRVFYIGVNVNGLVRFFEPFSLTFTNGSRVVSSPSPVSSEFVDFVNKRLEESGSPVEIFITYSNFLSSNNNFIPYIAFNNRINVIPPFDSNYSILYFNKLIGIKSQLNRIIDSTDSDQLSSNPYVGIDPDIRINALPFRLYELLTNYYFRNDKNNPYYLNGEVQYNEFIPTHGDGPDDNVYDFHYKNWELDRFTSAVQSPQFGEAPLVGLTYNPDGRTAVLEFDNTGAEVSVDGSTPDKITATVGYDRDGRLTDIADFSKNIPSANLQKLMQQVNMGISINDLRVTNSFQRFLENTLRRGLRYRNQLKSHFGVSVDYPDIDIPQYIGGFSGYLNVGKTENMADGPSAGLGDFNGKLFGQVSSGRKIKCYCPEHGFIIGVVTISPVPVYPQACQKMLIKSNPFDYYLPEFGKIGFVPMHYSEVMPLQTGVGQDVEDVFGYQRAWYDYMQSYDTVHGDFRTTLRDFYVGRYFAERPELASDFTQINPEHLNDVFVTNNIADRYGSSSKFLLNIANHVVSVSPVPRIGTPSLE